jgi:RNA polymerase sigma-70 factor, ECF subfamily
VETFLAAFAKRDRYDLGHPDARPWLYGIAANLAGQHRRDQARQYRITQAAAAAQPEVPGHADKVAADVTAQAMRPLLAGALAALSAGDRDVLLLIAWEQLTYQEVSRALAIPVGTVQSRLHRARAKVRQVLAGTDAAATYEELTANE